MMFYEQNCGWTFKFYDQSIYKIIKHTKKYILCRLQKKGAK